MYGKSASGSSLDAETNLHQNYYRDYDPLSGRYIQSDLIGLGSGTSTFGYVGQNPISLSDRSGLCPWCPGAVGAVIGGITAGMSYNASNPNGSTGSLLGAMAAGAAIGAAAYTPAGWGLLGNMLAGAAAGASGDAIGQYLGKKDEAKACGKTFNFYQEWDGLETLTMAGVGAGAAGLGYVAVPYANAMYSSVAPYAGLTSAQQAVVAATVSGVAQEAATVALPTSVGGARR
ncbi:RHS repeat-associated core domain-containing protein [Solimicrobium silvestre]|uniref:RHS repeat-associated core domain n=1 Tax=Solimicrobium silvestre TaxID=2099400 RepID=A0A2S9GSB0_9BURK|nr:RHS repeat-associated core domain-containing protein [Solimicrobium silvestre]PRC90609.1 RHS repeat-associated core domain [Solimicrobium silvestre]